MTLHVCAFPLQGMRSLHGTVRLQACTLLRLARAPLTQTALLRPRMAQLASCGMRGKDAASTRVSHCTRARIAPYPPASLSHARVVHVLGSWAACQAHSHTRERVGASRHRSSHIVRSTIGVASQTEIADARLRAFTSSLVRCSGRLRRRWRCMSSRYLRARVAAKARVPQTRAKLRTACARSHAKLPIASARARCSCKASAVLCEKRLRTD